MQINTQMQRVFWVCCFLFSLCSMAQAFPQPSFGHHAVVTLPEITQFKGDAILVGGRINLQQEHHGDAIMAGGDTFIGGTLYKTAMVLSGRFAMTGQVKEDAVFVAGRSSLAPESVIEKDAYVLGGDVIVEGVVKGDLYIFGGRVNLGAKVAGDVYVVAGVLNVSPTTEIQGKLSYLTPSKPVLPTGARVGGPLQVWGGEQVMDSATMLQGNITQTGSVHGAEHFNRGFPNVLFHLGVAVVAMFAAIFCSGFSGRSLCQMRKHPWLSGFTGIFALILIPLLAIVLLITAVGAPMALIMFAGYFVALWLAYAIAVYAIGMGSLQLMGQDVMNAPVTKRLFAVLLGMLLIILLSHIPYVGGWIPVVIFFTGFGALLRTLFTIQVGDKV